MAQKAKQITVEDVIEFVMEPGSDSEMSELLSDDDEEYTPDEIIENSVCFQKVISQTLIPL